MDIVKEVFDIGFLVFPPFAFAHGLLNMVGGVLRYFLVKIDFDMFFEREPPNLQGVILFGKLYIGVLFLK